MESQLNACYTFCHSFYTLHVAFTNNEQLGDCKLAAYVTKLNTINKYFAYYSKSNKIYIYNA
jgi:hypothetical protein